MAIMFIASMPRNEQWRILPRQLNPVKQKYRWNLLVVDLFLG